MLLSLLLLWLLLGRGGVLAMVREKKANVGLSRGVMSMVVKEDSDARLEAWDVILLGRLVTVCVAQCVLPGYRKSSCN